jgi:hypothetical protein
VGRGRYLQLPIRPAPQSASIRSRSRLFCRPAARAVFSNNQPRAKVCRPGSEIPDDDSYPRSLRSSSTYLLGICALAMRRSQSSNVIQVMKELFLSFNA